MKTRQILSVFGLKAQCRRDSFGQWFIALSNQSPKYRATSIRGLIEMVVPPPPAALSPSPEAIAAWAEECAASAYGKVDPDRLAKAAFAAYGLSPSQEELSVFADAVRAWKRE